MALKAFLPETLEAGSTPPREARLPHKPRSPFNSAMRKQSKHYRPKLSEFRHRKISSRIRTINRTKRYYIYCPSCGSLPDKWRSLDAATQHALQHGHQASVRVLARIAPLDPSGQ